MDKLKMLPMIKEVKSLGLESCMTLGMLDDNQAQQLSLIVIHQIE